MNCSSRHIPIKLGGTASSPHAAFRYGTTDSTIGVVMEYSGSGDPARSLALLWRTQERVSRKGKPELSVERIVRTAIEIADHEGIGALSMRRVADRLGVGTMSLYTYVPGKPELIDVMLDTSYGEAVIEDESTRCWRDRLDDIARANWALYRRHPWMLQVATTRPPLGPNVTAKYENELRAVADLGLTELEMDSAVNLINAYVQGVARSAVEAAQAVQHTGMTDEQWWQAHAPFLNSFMDPGRFPTAARVGGAVGRTHGSPHDADLAFEFGLQRVLDGLDAFIAGRNS